MPGGPELAATADIGQYKHAAMLEPELAPHGVVAGRISDLESAVGCQQSRIRSVIGHILAMHHEVGDFGAVLRNRFELLDHIEAGVKLRLLRLGQSERSVAGIAEPERRWGEETLQSKEEAVVGAAGGQRFDSQIVRHR